MKNEMKRCCCCCVFSFPFNRIVTRSYHRLWHCPLLFNNNEWNINKWKWIFRTGKKETVKKPNTIHRQQLKINEKMFNVQWSMKWAKRKIFHDDDDYAFFEHYEHGLCAFVCIILRVLKKIIIGFITHTHTHIQ